MVGVGRSMDRTVQPSWNVIPKERANPLGTYNTKETSKRRGAVGMYTSRLKTSSSQLTDYIFDPENLVSGSRYTSEVTLSEVSCQNFPADDVEA